MRSLNFKPSVTLLSDSTSGFTWKIRENNAEVLLSAYITKPIYKKTFLPKILYLCWWSLY